MSLRDRMVEIIEEEGLQFKETPTALKTTCPQCGRDDKLSILKHNGAVICYRGSCQLKGWFADWLSLTAGITIKEARARIEGPARITSYSLDDTQETPQDAAPVRWPYKGLVPIGSEYFPEGRAYLERRGIPVDVAAHYGIMYGPDAMMVQPPHMQRRVFIPIMREGKCYGFQARAIDPVREQDRMRNNDGFRRDLLVMFEDRLASAQHVVICEGPFDAMKFHLVGGNIATMGKVVTQKQLELILSYRPKKVFLALDDDAGEEIMELSRKFPCPVYWVSVPEQATVRCRSAGRKADFGECTFEECQQAVREAVLVDETFLV